MKPLATDRAYLASLAKPASRSRLTMKQREKLALAGLKIQARRNVRTARDERGRQCVRTRVEVDGTHVVI